jgi:hypothetical protein
MPPLETGERPASPEEDWLGRLEAGVEGPEGPPPNIESGRGATRFT